IPQLTAGNIDTSAITAWAISFISDGNTAATAIHYLKHLSSLYNKAVNAGIAPSTTAFSETVALLRTLPLPRVTIDRNMRGRFQQLVSASGSAGSHNLATDITVFAILAGGLDFDSIARYTVDGYTGSDPLMATIAERYRRPGRRYLFPLGQSDRTPRRMCQHINTLFSATLGIAHDLTPADAWAHLALGLGLPPADVIAVTGQRTDLYPHLSLLSPAPLSAERRQKVVDGVAAALACNPPSWYAIQFRPRVAYETVAQRIEKIRAAHRIDATYYPSADIARRIGHRLVYENRPVVSGLLFIRCPKNGIYQVMRQLGDLAWCYRSAGADSAYASIPEKEINLYQLTIGILSPEINPVPAGAIELLPGDKVEILGGIFAGRTATVSRALPSGSDTTVYRLLLPGDNAIEWRIDTDARLISNNNNQSILQNIHQKQQQNI
ncbi:MAG: hypothetical protein K2H98_05040, partial [Duncaniella sp.]|nr:hypothetical protein [Duncaniella sp.]